MKLRHVFLTILALVIFACVETSFANYIGAMKAPVQVYVLGHYLDHTYSCIDNLSSCQSFSFAGIGSGNTYGGTLIGGQWNYATSAQASKAWCYSGCYMYYMQHGVCHQYTNRMLYAIGREIADNGAIQGYGFSRWTWGPRGTNFAQCAC